MEDDNEDKNLNGILPLLRSSANSRRRRRRSVDCVDRRSVIVKENGGLENGGYER